MDFHLEKKFNYIADISTKNLYSWALVEVDENGQKSGPEFIPWRWSLYFTATRMTLGDRFHISPENRRDKSGDTTATRSRAIRAILRPGHPRQDKIYGRTTYSMFGTDRTIEEFDLRITPFQNDTETKEECTAWGSVSYTSEIDFKYQTHGDCVSFHLIVKPETFEYYAALIANRSISEAFLQVGGVDGFYSEWSPGIHTQKIKVLTEGKEHAINLPHGVELLPSRLNKIYEVDLSIGIHNDLSTQS